MPWAGQVHRTQKRPALRAEAHQIVRDDVGAEILGGLQKTGDSGGMHEVVRVDDGDPRPTRRVEAKVPRRGRPAPVGAPKDPHAVVMRGKRGGDSRAVVAGGVIAEQDLKIAVGLRQNRCGRVAQVGRAIVERHDDRYETHRGRVFSGQGN